MGETILKMDQIPRVERVFDSLGTLVIILTNEAFVRDAFIVFGSYILSPRIQWRFGEDAESAPCQLA